MSKVDARSAGRCGATASVRQTAGLLRRLGPGKRVHLGTENGFLDELTPMNCSQACTQVF